MGKQLERIQVIGLGQACVDYLGTLPSYPLEDGKAELTDLQIQCGGPASTALVTLSRLGIPTSFLGSISDDPSGLRIIENLKNENVDVSWLKVTPGHTSQFAFIAISEKMEKRTIFWHRGSVPHLTPKDVDIASFSKAKILHLDGLMIEASMEAATQAKALGMTVVLDAGTMRQGSKKLVALVDILIASETFATPLVGIGATNDTALRALHGLGPKQVIITLGQKGSIGLNDQGIFNQEAFRVRAKDTTGAGDVYHGAYIYGLLQDWDMPRCMCFASATAALSCQKIGTRAGIPNLKAVHEFLKTHESKGNP
jgi:sulfofructose kinase